MTTENTGTSLQGWAVLNFHNWSAVVFINVGIIHTVCVRGKKT
jgi:hypothetical protein